ncbi:MAG: hypothetical protein WCV88_06110 [Patescibacteria group bacterium]|jgi:hypothetical protein
MSNQLGNGVFNPAFWSNEMQVVFFKENVALALANTELRDQLSVGDVIHKPYRSRLHVKNYTKGSDITVFDVSGTDEYLTVDTTKIVPFYVDDLDKIQNKWDMATKFSADAQRLLNNVLEQAVLSEYSNASSNVYLADIGGSGATTAIPLTTANVQNVFTAASRKLDQLDIPQGQRFAVIGPRALEVLRLQGAGRETGVGDVVQENGRIGNRFGFELYYSNNVPFTATLTTSAAIANAETVTINGCTFTFKDAAAVNAGEVYSGGSDADTTTQLVAAINACSTGVQGTSTTYILPSEANMWKITKAGIVATDATTSITLVGYGDIAVSGTMGQAANVWSAQQQHLVFGMKGATDLVVQKSPSVEFRVAEKRLGKYVYPWTLYGKKTFTDMKDALAVAHLDASSWT